MEIIKNRAQLPNEDEDSGEDEDNQLSEETAGPVRRRKRADQKASAEHSRQRKGKAKVNVLANSGSKQTLIVEKEENWISGA